MSPGSDDHLRDLQRRLVDAERRLDRVPARWAQAAVAPSYRTISIIGGNTAQIGGSIEGIQYIETLATLTQAYNPNVDTVYPAGLGYGALFVDGVRQPGNVLVRHNFVALGWAVLGSALVRPCGTVSLTYTPGGGGPAIAMSAYIFDWV